MPAERFLVDTSVWLEVLPPGRNAEALRQRIDALLAEDLVATTGMVRLELLGGARSSEEWARLGGLLAALHFLPATDADWDESARLGFELRRQGITVPFTDILIAAISLQAGTTLLHRDRHFDLIAAHTSLQVESHVEA